MAYIRYLIEIYKKKDLGNNEYEYNTSPDKQFTVVATDNDKSIEATADSFSFRIFNVRDSSGVYIYQEDIKVDDRVLIYITSKEDIVTASNKALYRRFDGLISQISYEVTVDGRVLNVKGESRLRKLMDFTWPAVYKPTGSFTSTASNIIQNLIEQVNQENPNNTITWDSGNDTTSTEIQYFRNYRPVIEMVNELSTQKVNEEFNAYFYLSTDNKFVWKLKGKDNRTLELREGRDFFKVKIDEKVWEVVNAVIVDCGKDPSGNSTHAMYYDVASAGEYGLKWANTIEPMNEISESIMKIAKGSAGWVNNSDANKQNFPNSYPVTLDLEARDPDTGALLGTFVTITSDSDWVQKFRREAKWQGVAWIKMFVDMTGHVRPKVDIEMQGATWELGANRTGLASEGCLDSSANPIAIGDYVNVIIPSRGGDFETGVNLRVVQVNHEVSSKGWVVTVRLEVDVDDAISYTASGHT